MERHTGLSCNRSCEQCFTGPWWTDKKHSFGNPTAEFLKFFRILQESDDFLKFNFRFINARNIRKCDTASFLAVATGSPLPELEIDLALRPDAPEKEICPDEAEKYQKKTCIVPRPLQFNFTWRRTECEGYIMCT